MIRKFVMLVMSRRHETVQRASAWTQTGLVFNGRVKTGLKQE